MWFRHTDRRTPSLLSLSLLSAEERVPPQAAPCILGQQTSARHLRAGCQGFKEAKGIKCKLLGCTFSGFHILRSCLSACKVMFLLWTLPYDMALRLATEAQERLRATLADMLDMPLADTQWALARLPVRKGGLGILDPVTAAAPAHVASFLSSSAGALAHDLPSCEAPQSFFTALASLSQSSPAHASDLRTLVRVGHPLAVDVAQRELFDTWCDQHQWTDAVHECSCGLLDSALPLRLRRLRELATGAHAGA